MCRILKPVSAVRAPLKAARNRFAGVFACVVALGALVSTAVLPDAAASAPAVVQVPCTVDGSNGLVAAIETANRAGGGVLELARECTYTLKKPDDNADGSNGLPVLTGRIRITGKVGTTIARSSAPGTPRFRIIEVGEHATVAITHVTIAGGFSTAEHDGGGVDNQGTITSLSDDTIRDNTAGGGGGGVDNAGTITDFNHDKISHNSAVAGPGGGVFNFGGTIARFTHDTVVGNRARQGGAGIFNLAGSITMLQHCTISDNHVTHNLSGGGLSNRFGTVDMNHDTISHNTATAGFASSGGGIDNSGNSAKLTLSDSLVSDNVARGTGGGLANAGTAVFVIRSTKVIHNTVTSPHGPAVGGGIHNAARMSLADSTVRGNEARAPIGRAVGAGIYNVDYLTVKGTSIAGNVVDGRSGEAEGGGLYVDEDSKKTALESSTVTDNRAVGAHPHGAGIFFAGGAPVTLAKTVVTANAPDACYPFGSVTGCNTAG